ncbi:uncharacterized protein LOC123560228 [Mercenaria mercenaria]|uniref:uncharacterized protein LOC123560228 n=1 Tax=Mercenaria mercenaria TaxID=6596 RepID=UPI00234F72E6|nr:uncharacterized protein LOC123560228 [Mercenaria mercenaria]XP_045208401.2 uncharacterized protein LOC123560228 [Mercenaria mercenaria]
MMNYSAAILVVLFAFLENGVVGEELSDYLWKQTAKYHQEALVSNYIQGIRAVSLDPTEFGAYNVQDAVYVYWFKESIDIAAVRTTDTALKQFLQNKSKSHDVEYKKAFKAWHINDPNGIHLGSACQNYVNHLVDVAMTMDGNYLVTALIPCARLWPWLGQQIGADSGKFGIYNKWVQENLNPSYTGYTTYEQVINEAFANGTITKEKALQVYGESMMGEVAFFNSVSKTIRQGLHEEL